MLCVLRCAPVKAEVGGWRRRRCRRCRRWRGALRVGGRAEGGLGAGGRVIPTAAAPLAALEGEDRELVRPPASQAASARGRHPQTRAMPGLGAEGGWVRVPGFERAGGADRSLARPCALQGELQGLAVQSGRSADPIRHSYFQMLPA